MNTEIIIPTDRKHWLEMKASVISSTEIAALFGLSKYSTAFELWHRKKKGNIVEIEDNEVMKWGRRLESAIAEGVAEDKGWNIRRMEEFMIDRELRIGSSFDYSIEETRLTGEIASGEIDVNAGAINYVKGTTLKETVGIGLLEIKNVFGMIFKDEWLEDEDGNTEAPPHIELQVQFQLMVSGRAFAYIAALVSGNKLVLLKRTPDPKIISAIKMKVAEFWDSIDANTPPEPNFKTDSEFLSQLFSYAEPGKIIDARSNEKINRSAKLHREINEQIKTLEAQKESLKAELLMQVGDAEKVLGDGFSISAGMVGPAHVEYDRQGYRLFKINWPRGKKNA